MVTQAQTDMDKAVREWLEAYQGNERYLAATERLFTVFAHSWQGSRRYVNEAFGDFREALLKQHGLKSIEVAKVFPRAESE